MLLIKIRITDNKDHQIMLSKLSNEMSFVNLWAFELSSDRVWKLFPFYKKSFFETWKQKKLLVAGQSPFVSL